MYLLIIKWFHINASNAYVEETRTYEVGETKKAILQSMERYVWQDTVEFEVKTVSKVQED